MRIYIAGPMTGYPEHNYPAFFRAEEELRQLHRGAFVKVINPARLFDGDLALEWEEYLLVGLRSLLTCTHVHMLAGWERSRGARLEHTVAQAVGSTITYEIPSSGNLDEFHLQALLPVLRSELGAAKKEAAQWQESSGQNFVRAEAAEDRAEEAERKYDVAISAVARALHNWKRCISERDDEIKWARVLSARNQGLEQRIQDMELKHAGELEAAQGSHKGQQRNTIAFLDELENAKSLLRAARSYYLAEGCLSEGFLARMEEVGLKSKKPEQTKEVRKPMKTWNPDHAR